MIEIQSAVLEIIGQQHWQLFIVFLRVSAVVSMLPAFGERSVPVRIKLGIALAFTFIVAPAVDDVDQVSGVLPFARLVAAEATSGLALGAAVRLFVIALQMAGAIAAQATSLSQLLGAAAAEPTPAMGYLLMIAGLALAMVADLHIRAAEYLIGSYSILPAGKMPVAEDLSTWGVTQVTRAFSIAFGLSAPFVIASLIYNLTLGVINRAMPQLMVAFVGAPVITMGGLALLLVSAPLMLTVWLDMLISFLLNPLEAAP